MVINRTAKCQTLKRQRDSAPICFTFKQGREQGCERFGMFKAEKPSRMRVSVKVQSHASELGSMAIHPEVGEVGKLPERPAVTEEAAPPVQTAIRQDVVDAPPKAPVKYRQPDSQQQACDQQQQAQPNGPKRPSGQAETKGQHSHPIQAPVPKGITARSRTASPENLLALAQRGVPAHCLPPRACIRPAAAWPSLP